MSTIITPSEEQINIVVNDEKISINVESGDVIVNVTENIVEVSTVNGGYPLPTTVYSVFGRTGNIIAVDGDYDLGELGDVTLVSSTNGDVLTYDGTKWINKAVTGTGTVTSVDMSVPVGLQVSGNPISTVGTLAVNFAAGYSLPTTAKQTTWDAAYNDSIVSASVSGTTTKTLTLNQQDGGTITASWTDIDTNLVTSVNGYVGTVVLTTTDIAEGTRLYYTETRVSNNVDVAANTAARHSAVTIGTANGLSLASQVLSLALASASTTGALTSTDWVKFNTAYNDSIVSANVSGTTTKTLTLTQQDAGTITASWSDLAASGTVTSVAATVPTGLTISGSPIVSAGTLAFGLSAGYTIPLSTQLVPSGGTAGQLLTKNSATNYDTAWMDNYADWTEQLRDTVKAEVAINKGQAVYISGANGTNQLVSLASNTTEGTSSKTLGLAMQNLAVNGIGQIITEGLLGGLNTSTATAGDPVWLGVSGNLIYGLANKPVAPAHLVYIGVVTRVNSNNGEIYVKIQNGFELQELHNVLISSVANNEGLFYESATSLWKNKSIATVLGYTPISLTSLSGVSPLSYNNTTGAFSIAQATTSANGYLSSTDWNIFNGKQAALNGTGFVKATGTTISYDNSAYITLSSLGATSPLIYSSFSGNFSIDKADTSLSGYLSATDWNTFNNKQASGNYITALSGEATASGPGSATVTLSTSAVTGKLLTGVNITGGSITATDSILVAFGKIQNQINGVLGGAIYQSVWNASTNSPTLTSGTGTKGYYYIVSVAGSTNLDGITDWKVGDWAIFNGTTWNKVDNTDAVSSVNGYTGAVSLTTSDITEGSRLYYTEVRVSANTDVAANTAARHAAVTIGTANGLSLSTQALSLALSSTSATGALSSTDWNTFNNKQKAFTVVGPLTYNTTTNELNINKSSSTVSGWLSYDDWTTFNGKQAALSGTGFVKISGSTISYDNSTYLTTSSAASTYLPLAGGTLTGPLFGTSASFSGNIFSSSASTPRIIADGLSGQFAAFNIYFSGVEKAAFYADSTNKRILIGGTGDATYETRIIYGNNSLGLTLASTGAAFTSSVTATSFIKTSGTSSQFLKADGSVDSSTYLTTSSAASTYQTILTNPVTYTGTPITNYLPKFTGASTIGNSIVQDDGSSVTIGGTLQSFNASPIFLFSTASTSNYEVLAIDKSATDARIRVYKSGTGSYRNLIFETGGSTMLTLDTSGNLGLGVTPSAWASGWTAYQVKTSSFFDDGGATVVGRNLYNNSGDKYIGTGNATAYVQVTGQHLWLTSISGTANAAVTFTTAMTLNASGQLGIGTATIGSKLQVNGNAAIGYSASTAAPTNGLAVSGAIYLNKTTGTSAGINAVSLQVNNEIMATGSLGGFFMENRSGGVTSTTNWVGWYYSGTTLRLYNGSADVFSLVASTGATTFSSSVTATGFFESSDSRLKTLIQDNYQTKGIASITPKLYTKNGKVELGYYAQDFVGILDSAVSKGSDDMLSLSYREVHTAKIYALEQEIKELKAKVN